MSVKGKAFIAGVAVGVTLHYVYVNAQTRQA